MVRFPHFFLALALLTPAASAQVTVRITTAPSGGVGAQACTMTTDSSGLSLVPGSVDLQATGVVFSPAGCGQGGGGTTPPPAPTPANFALNGIPAAVSVLPSTLAISWDVSNATSCVGLATFNGTATTIHNWTDVSAVTPPSRTVTLTAAGYYVFAMQCSNSASPPVSITSQPYGLTATAGGGTGACPGPSNLQGRLLTSDITYGASNQTVRPRVDVTEWNNIWGHATASPSEGITPWPGVGGAGPVLRDFARVKFLGAHFNTGNVPVHQGSWAYQSNYGGPNIDIVVSTTCGDFAVNAVHPGCSLFNIYSDGQPSLRYFSNNEVPGTLNCPLQLNTDYYLNIKYTNPTSPVECLATSPTCPLFSIDYWSYP